MNDQPVQQQAVLQVLHFELAGRFPPMWQLQGTPDHPHRPLYPEVVVSQVFSQSKLLTNLCQGHIPLFVQCIVPLCFPDLDGHLREKACKRSASEGNHHLIPPSPHLILGLALVLELSSARGCGRCLLLVTHPPAAGCAKDVSQILQTDCRQCFKTTKQTDFLC